MLRITTIRGRDQTTRTLQARRQAPRPWIGELESACGESRFHRTAFASTSAA